MNTSLLLLFLLTGASICCFLAWIFQVIAMDNPWERILVGISYRKETFFHANKILTVANVTTFIGMVAASLLLVDAVWWRMIVKWQALFLISLILLSDGLDGFFARSLKQCSTLGQKIDPARDRETGLAILVLLLRSGEHSAVTFLVVGVLLAELFIGVIAVIANRQKRPLTVHTIGKCRMGLHIIAGMTFIAFPETALWVALAMFLASVSAATAYAIAYWQLATKFQENLRVSNS